MPAMAAQQPPKKAANAPKRTGAQAPDPQKKKDSGLKTRLQELPQAAGIAILALLLVISLFAGNFRALQSATPKAFLRQGDVKSIVEDRIDAAQNVLTVAGRVGLDGEAIRAAESAVGALEKAKTAREISRADQALTAAVSELTTAPLSGEDERSMLRAADDFAEQGSFLRQEARDYNKQAQKAEALYEKLPTKFVLPEPDVYEGI
ncbi:MAG: hypothetical protein ACI4MP_04670 [Candidatus Ventricola sp.]